MYLPPNSPRDPPFRHNPSWSDVATGFAVLLAIPVLLWIASYPIVGSATVIGLFGLRAAVRRARARIERLYEQCCVVFRVGENIRITISRNATETAG